MSQPLVRCTNCKRHIYASEASCPFCARQSLTSSGVLAAALSAGLAVAGCASEPAVVQSPIQAAPRPDYPPEPPNEIAEDPKVEQDRDNVTVAPAYGAPPRAVETPIMPPSAAYGAPPPLQQPPR